MSKLVEQWGWGNYAFNARVAQDTQYSATAIVAAPAASRCIYIKDIDICNGSAAGTTTFSLKDGSTVVFKIGLAASTSVCHTFGVPIRITAATALTCDSSQASTGAFVGVNGYVGS